MLKDDITEIKIAASNLLDTHSKTNWQNILTAYLDIVGHGNNELIKLAEEQDFYFFMIKDF